MKNNAEVKAMMTAKDGLTVEGYEEWGPKNKMLLRPGYMPSFDELSDPYPKDEFLPLLDQREVKIKGLTKDQLCWRENGYVIKRNFIPSELVDDYIELRKSLDLGRKGFPNAAPYLQHEIIRDICCYEPLHRLMTDLVGEEMGLHFNLSDFKSSGRGWHQDDYFNPPDTYGRYLAVWFSMGEIHPDSGPFEYIPGSHRWPCLSGEKIRSFIVPEGRSMATMMWCVYSECFVNRAFEDQIQKSGLKIEKFMAHKGDVLVWHAKLAHRGSLPSNNDLVRPALIGHYSNIRNRRDFSQDISRHGTGGYYWDMGAGHLGNPSRYRTSQNDNVRLEKVQISGMLQTKAGNAARRLKRALRKRINLK